jgi:hypothetical protein
MRNEPQRYAADKDASRAIRKTAKRGDRKTAAKLKPTKKKG